ncbi:DUF542 domain-containing protein [Cyclobacterium jeungdonense]|uniref:DUF542 domain-containing protein n=1 Tax=Cyclobacterium jeungdonense TaxID=708087 RepID=A0ABT8C7H3_9BACT|nr:DUF542 domain-containing protein [Cyclobacterium jeungdonense]MDN3688720.1 DUF542 domain-containing protein [Cyclobacterium jeungdonense]
MDFDFRTFSVGDLVAADSRVAVVLDAYGIDYCCHGNEPLAEVCKRLSISSEGLARHLKIHLRNQSSPKFYFDFWPMGLLASYIERKHHRFIKVQVPLLVRLFNEAMEHPSESAGSLPELREIFWKVAEDLLDHVAREERILFPYLRKMETNDRGEIPFAASHFDTVRESIVTLFREHHKEGACLQDLRSVTNGYKLSIHSSYWERLIYPQLEAFDKDMKTHLHLENNILFPKALSAAENVSSLV